jgi:hypothetical protein
MACGSVDRERACEIAGVEPRYQTMSAKDADAHILSLNIARRHLNKGQIAVVVAMAYPEVGEKGRGKKSIVSIHFPMVNPLALSQARAIVRHAPELADEVLRFKGRPFAEAFETARQRKAESESNAEKKNRLRREAPDLADLRPPPSWSSASGTGEIRPPSASRCSPRWNPRGPISLIQLGKPSKRRVPCRIG